MEAGVQGDLDQEVKLWQVRHGCLDLLDAEVHQGRGQRLQACSIKDHTIELPLYLHDSKIKKLSNVNMFGLLHPLLLLLSNALLL